MQLTSDQRQALDAIKTWLGVSNQPEPAVKPEPEPVDPFLAKLRASAEKESPPSKTFKAIAQATVRDPYSNRRLQTRGGMFTLAGHSGTGKSTLVRKLCTELGPEGRRGLILTAPTNKATKVLRAMLAEEGINDVGCFTIHKANGLTMADDKEEKYLVKRGEGVVNEARVVVVDEASMVGERMFDMIEGSLVSNGISVLFVGDEYQLAPVRDGTMRAFDPVNVENQAKLTQIVRQAEGHPVIELGEFFRRCIDGERSRPPEPNNNGDGAGVFYLPSVPFYRTMINEFVAHRDEPGAFRAIAWTNRTVDELATRARAALHGENAPRYLVGERMFTAKPFEDMHTDQECTILELGEVESHPLYHEFEAIPILIELDDHAIEVNGETFRMKQQGFAPADEFKVNREIEQLRKKAYGLQNVQRQSGRWDDKRKSRDAWKEFHAFQAAWVDLRSVHAMTAHRSQGSTFDSVFVDAQDIRRASEKFRLLYVACTRARNRVYIRES